MDDAGLRSMWFFSLFNSLSGSIVRFFLSIRLIVWTIYRDSSYDTDRVKHNSTTFIYLFIYFEQTGPLRPLTVNTVGYKRSPGHAILLSTNIIIIYNINILIATVC